MSPAENRLSKLPAALLLGLAVIAAGVFLSRGQQDETETAEENDVVLLGAVLPLSGDAAAAGSASEAGFMLAKEEIAARPDLYAPVRIFLGDSEFDPEQGKAVANKLIERDVDVLFSSFSYVTTEVNSLAKDAGIPLFYDSCNCGFAEENPSAFQLYFDPRKECRAVAEHFKGIGVTKAAFLGQDVPYGRYCYEAVQDVLGIENVVIETEPQDARRDYPSLLSSLQNQDVGFLISVPAVNDFGSLFKANRASDAPLPIACFEGICLTDETIAAAGDAIDEALGFGFAIDSAFAAKANERGITSRAELIAAAITYDVARYTAMAGKRCGSDSACIVGELQEVSLPDPAVHGSGFGEDRILDYASTYVEVVGGKRLPIEL